MLNIECHKNYCAPCGHKEARTNRRVETICRFFATASVRHIKIQHNIKG